MRREEKRRRLRRRRGRRTTGAQWPNLVKLMSSRFSERLYLKNKKVGSQGRRS